MAAYLRPRRGTASGSTVVLKEGEIFLDTAKSAQATTLSSWGQIYVGNNSANLNALKPFVSLPENMVVANGISATGDDSNIANGKSLSTIFSAIKKLLSDHATSIDNLNNDKVSKTGDTMTGYLTMTEPIVFQTGNSNIITVYDRNNRYRKYIHFGSDTTGDQSYDLPKEDGVLATQDYVKDNSINCQQVQFNLPSAVSFNPYGTANLLTDFDIKNSTIVDTVFTNKTLTSLFGYKTIKGAIGLYATGVLIRDCIVWPNSQKININAYNPWNQTLTVNAVRLLVFYSR